MPARPRERISPSSSQKFNIITEIGMHYIKTKVLLIFRGLGRLI